MLSHRFALECLFNTTGKLSKSCSSRQHHSATFAITFAITLVITLVITMLDTVISLTRVHHNVLPNHAHLDRDHTVVAG